MRTAAACFIASSALVVLVDFRELGIDNIIVLGRVRLGRRGACLLGSIDSLAQLHRHGAKRRRLGGQRIGITGLGEIGGVGTRKLEAYGDAFVNVIRQF